MTDIPQSTIDELRRLYSEACPEWLPAGHRGAEEQRQQYLNSCGAYYVAAAKHLPALLTALEAAQANERRYLWLKQSSWTIRRYVPAVFQEVRVGTDLDAAIDAATGGENG